MDKEATVTTSISLFFAWLCNHVGEIEGFIIFFVTLIYLYWKIRYAYAKTKKAERELAERELDDDELL